MSKQLTAVEWLRKKMLKVSFNYEQLFKEAKEMEWEQIDKSYQKGYANGYTNRVYGNK